MQAFVRKAEAEEDPSASRSIFDETKVIATRYSGDSNFEALVKDVQTRLHEQERERRGEPPMPDPQPEVAPRPPKPPIWSEARKSIAKWTATVRSSIARQSALLRADSAKLKTRLSNFDRFAASLKIRSSYAAALAGLSPF